MWNSEDYKLIQRKYQNHYGTNLLKLACQYCINRNIDILDLGCGDGFLTKTFLTLRNNINTIDAVDIDQNMIKAANSELQCYNNIKLYQIDMISFLKKSNKMYDLVFSNAVLHWLNSLTEFETIFSLLTQRTYPESIIAVRFSLNDNAYDSKFFLQDAIREYTNDNNFIIKKSVLKMDKCTDIFTKLNYKILKKEKMEYIPFSSDEDNFNWLISAQPIESWIPKEDIPKFKKFIRKRWEHNHVRVRSSHAMYILKNQN